MDTIFIVVGGLIAIVFTFWFFFMKKDTEVIVSDAVDITVDGGYTPASIVLKKGAVTKITFLRKDPSACLEEVVLSDFNIRKTLPLHQPVTVEVTPHQTGEFPFSCGMNMFHGKIIVK